MEGRDRLADTMIREEMRKLNAHLPKQRRTLSELLAEETPSVPSADGGKIVMRKTELEDLERNLPDSLRGRVRLPFVFLRRTDLGTGAFTLLGDPAEELAILALISDNKETLEEFRRKQTRPTVFFKPQVSELVRRLHSLIVIGFGVSEDPYK
jgi:uncharacterized protein (UPF0216 family)